MLKKKADTEVLLFAAPKTEDFLTSWSEIRRQSGGRFRFNTSERPLLSWNLALSHPAFLHFRIAATESFPIEAHFANSVISRHDVKSNKSVQTIPLPPETTRVEMWIPPARSLGVSTAVITPSREVAEFRKPKEFPFVEKLSIGGKKRNAIFCETGGSVVFYEAFSPETEIEFGYYFIPSNNMVSDAAVFSVLWTTADGKEQTIFQQRATERVFRNVRVPLHSNAPSSQPSKLEFRIARDTAFGSTQTAWIDPRVRQIAMSPTKNPSAPETLRKSFEGANVIFIILDAASVRHFHSYGYSKNTTPVTDQLASEGVRFERAYTNAVYTLACSATILTGFIPARHGVLLHRNKLPSGFITLPEMLQASGYETASFLANGNVSAHFGLTQGFRTSREVFRDKNYVGRGEDITRAFSEWLKSNGDRKFFAYLHYREPHDPYQPPIEWVKKYTDPSYNGSILRDFEDRKPIEKNAPGLTSEDRSFIKGLYDANLAYGDFQVGEVVRLLKRSNLYDRTMIIVTSDHGEAFWEHGYQGHNLQLYEESARVPLVIKPPANSGLKGKHIHHPVQHADFYATLRDLLGISSRGSHTDGSSFAALLSGNPRSKREIITQTTRRPVNSIIFGDFKYIENTEKTDELYDLKKDPSESVNKINTDSVRAGYLRYLLFKRLDSAGKKTLPTEKAAELDEAARENLKALGYLD